MPLTDEAFWLDFDATKWREVDEEEEEEEEAKQKQRLQRSSAKSWRRRSVGELTLKQACWECCSCEEASHQAVVACCLRLLQCNKLLLLPARQWCGRQIVRWRWRDLLFIIYFYVFLGAFWVFYANALCSVVFNSEIVVFIFIFVSVSLWSSNCSWDKCSVCLANTSFDCAAGSFPFPLDVANWHCLYKQHINRVLGN